MKVLSTGVRGPQVQLLQLALIRAGYDPGGTDGIFGSRTLRALRTFQSMNGLTPDGIAGPLTHARLRPFYVGYAVHTVQSGETFYRLATAYGTTVRAIETANPGSDPLQLMPGMQLVIPLPFRVVPTAIDWCSELAAFCCEGIAMRYPFVEKSAIGTSVMGRPLWLLTLGSGENRVFYNAEHHANEWITTPLLMKFTEEMARAAAFGLSLGGVSAQQLLARATLAVVPAVDPDGMDLVTGDLTSGEYYEGARRIAANFPAIPFPSGWKANIRGTDLNLQYPAGWEIAREIKFAAGFTRPAPRDYVGAAPLSAPESRAVYEFTRAYSPALTLSYHTQGGVIYWKYGSYAPPGSFGIAQRFSEVSGYTVEDTPYASGHAGYKDWFITEFGRPGFTIEAGSGQNPLPITDFDLIYRDNLGILLLGMALEDT